MKNVKCPICKSDAETNEPIDHGGRYSQFFECASCGNYIINPDLLENDVFGGYYSEAQIALLAHIMTKNRWRHGEDRLYLTEEWIDVQLHNKRLPNPKELRDNFVMWLAEHTGNFGNDIKYWDVEDAFLEIGALNRKALSNITNWCVENNYVKISSRTNNDARFASYLELTLEGWEYYESIKSSNEDSKRAFMAMPFGKEELDKVFKDYWKPAVEAAGFTLERLDERPKAGSIDDRLRQTIRRSAFLICELTQANRGAYWEAGFAEGIGIPVIYTCREDCHKTDAHFDVNHHLCVIWNEDNLEEKKKELTATIRETMR
jgi:hypothetical protein